MHRVGHQQRISRPRATKTDGSDMLDLSSVKLASDESWQIVFGADLFEGQS